MRPLLEVIKFEIRYQLRSPFFLGALLMFALIHFLAITGAGIHIDNFSNQIAINSAYGSLQIELVLFGFGMLPIVAFVTTAMTRDFARATAPLVFVTPISPKTFVLGRFLGALIPALLIALAGLLGALIGTFMPWLDQARIAPFTLLPWAYIFFVVILPSTLVLCAIFFSVAALTRSFALTFAAAIAFFVADVLLNLYANFEWAALADPVARLTVAAETRYWTVAELNTNIPLGMLPQNRLLWLTVALLALLFVLLRFRLDLDQKARRVSSPRVSKGCLGIVPFGLSVRTGNAALAYARATDTCKPAIQKITPVLSFSPRASFAQFVSQLKMDLSCVFKSLLIYIILALVIAQIIGEFLGNVSRVGLETPLYPLTSLTLPLLRFGMLGNILLVGLWYSAELIHRERASGVDEIINASPFPNWLMILSKTAALCLVINALMLVAVLTFNIAAMMETAKRGLEMYSTEFAPYPYSYLRILEFPRYRSAGKFHSGTVPLSEGVGFVNDLRAVGNADYGVMHELAHMWWGERITGAQIQGRWLLTENMADYSTMMLFKEYYPPVFANRIVRGMLDGYLKGRSGENEAEAPVMYTERHGYLRAKGPHALYALQDIIGKDKVHQALRNFLKAYSFQTSPCPTSRDLVNALRAEAGPEYQQLITDLFERIVLYDLQVDAASAREIAGGYEVTIEVTAKQFAADGHGKETEEPLDTWFDVALFAETDKPLEEVTPLSIAKHRLQSGKQSLTVRTTEKPGIVGLDPFHKRIERSAGNNSLKIAALPITVSRLSH